MRRHPRDASAAKGTSSKITSPLRPLAQLLLVGLLTACLGESVSGARSSPGDSTPSVPVAGDPAGGDSAGRDPSGGDSATGDSTVGDVEIGDEAVVVVTTLLTRPASDQVLHAPVDIEIVAAAGVIGDTLARVELYDGTTLLHTATAPPYTFTLADAAVGVHVLSARAVAAGGAEASSSPVTVTVNSLPAIALTSPTEGEVYAAPPTIELAVDADDADGTIARVDYYDGARLIGSATTAPFDFTWTEAPTGVYAFAVFTFTAVATDDRGGSTASASITVSAVEPARQWYFIHTDHLTTPRLVTDETHQPVWSWLQSEPFGDGQPEDSRAGFGPLPFNLRFPGQYADVESDWSYNYFRDYMPRVGRYAETDPIGLAGGTGLYPYVAGAPLNHADSRGLDIDLDIIDLDLLGCRGPKCRGTRKSQVLQDFTRNYTGSPDVLSVLAHGNEQFVGNQVNILLDPPGLARLIRRHPKWKRGMPIVLIACNTGSLFSLTFAQRLADILGVTVIAPNWYGHVAPDGGINVADEGKILPGTMVRHVPRAEGIGKRSP